MNPTRPARTEFLREKQRGERAREREREGGRERERERERWREEQLGIDAQNLRGAVEARHTSSS